MPLGWRPNDVNDEFPLEVTENPYLQKKYDPHNSNFQLGWAWIQFSLAGIFMFVILYSMEEISFLIINLISSVLILHIMSYTFLLDNNKLAMVMELLKFILSCFVLFLLHQNDFFISNIIYVFIISYLIISMGITIYLSNNQTIH
jgi:hypothetical protein